MYVTASQLTIHNEFKTDVREGGIAAIGPQSEVRVGQSSAVTTRLNLICLSGMTNQPVKLWVPGFRKQDGSCHPVWEKGQNKG
ncbi:unnamed protein product [Porites lobata]|uniref:Uncharacterized protein n=1 Tax=Porites lobata TaxID=104759 RepID=A0ABN8NQ35_9CNID|nr:unnamed protein product [Porites lobata]